MTSASLIKQERSNSSAGPALTQQSFSLYPEVPLANVVHRTPRYGHSLDISPCQLPPIFPNPPSPSPPIILPSTSSTSTTLSDSPPRPHIPRPPNSFMLFRSDFLKRGVIPSNVERRQQNISRIVGEVWNMMDPAKKAEWHERAAVALREHQQKNPGYKFMPAPRGSRRNRIRGRGDAISDNPDNIRDIREKYVNIIGPSPPSVRKRRQQKIVDTKKQNSISPLSTAPNSGTSSFFPPLTKPHDVIRIDQSPPLTPYHSPMTFPEPSISRRPSTSLGFCPAPKRHHVSYDSPDSRIGFLDYVREHGEELPLSINQFGSVSVPSSPLPYESTVWSSYSTVGTTNLNGSEPIISGTATEYQEAGLPSITAPVVNNASPGYMDNCSSIDGDDATAFLASLGFTSEGEVFAGLTPTFDNTQVPLDESLWLTSGSLNFGGWDLNVCPADNVFSFTVGNF